MPRVPANPSDFFSSWLPAHFRTLASKLGSQTSPGAIVFKVGERSPFALRLVRGALELGESVPPDTIVQVSLSEEDFEPVLVRGAELLESSSSPDQQLSVLRALSLDAERVSLIRSVPGSVAFVLTGGEKEHRICLTPGAEARDTSRPECVIKCDVESFLAMQRGAANPFELMMNGKLQISGDAQIPMALSSLLV